MESGVRTTGGKGLHLTVPLEPIASWDSCFEFSRRIANSLARASPSTFTVDFGKRARTDHILIDYKRNHRAAVAIAAYSTRARPSAPVSVPLAWDELATERTPDRWTVKNLRQHLE